MLVQEYDSQQHGPDSSNASPYGICRADRYGLYRSHMLAVRLTMNPAAHKRNAMPFEPFIFPMQKAKAVSNMPAVIKIIQSIGESFNVIRF